MPQHIPKLEMTIILGLAGALIFSNSACTPPSAVGTDLFAEESFQIRVIDSVSLKVSTIMLDSVDTYKPDRLLLGFHEDELLGKVLAAPFFELAPDGWTTQPDENTTIFDSLTLVLQYDGYSLYDTSQLQTVRVHQLLDRMELNDDGTLYNSSNFAYAPTPIGTLRFRPRPTSNGQIEIRLDEALGQEFFGQIQTGETTLSNSEDFKDYFPGLVVLPDTSTTNIFLGLQPTPQLKLYYRDLSSLPATNYEITFSYEASGLEYAFNRIVGQWENTLLAPLLNDDESANELSSRQLGNVAVVQGGTGLTTRIEFPYLKSLLDLEEEFVVVEARLKVQPIMTDYADQFELPEVLTPYWVDENNLVEAVNPLSALLHTDLEFARDVYYEVDILSFVQRELSRETLNNSALLLYFSEPDYTLSTHTILLGDDRHPTAPMELSITLLSVK